MLPCPRIKHRMSTHNLFIITVKLFLLVQWPWTRLKKSCRLSCQEKHRTPVRPQTDKSWVGSPDKYIQPQQGWKLWFKTKQDNSSVNVCKMLRQCQCCKYDVRDSLQAEMETWPWDRSFSNPGKKTKEIVLLYHRWLKHLLTGNQEVAKGMKKSRQTPLKCSMDTEMTMVNRSIIVHYHLGGEKQNIPGQMLYLVAQEGPWRLLHRLRNGSKNPQRLLHRFSLPTFLKRAGWGPRKQVQLSSSCHRVQHGDGACDQHVYGEVEAAIIWCKEASWCRSPACVAKGFCSRHVLLCRWKERFTS